MQKNRNIAPWRVLVAALFAALCFSAPATAATLTGYMAGIDNAYAGHPDGSTDTAAGVPLNERYATVAIPMGAGRTNLKVGDVITISQGDRRVVAWVTDVGGLPHGDIDLAKSPVFEQNLGTQFVLNKDGNYVKALTNGSGWEVTKIGSVNPRGMSNPNSVNEAILKLNNDPNLSSKDIAALQQQLKDEMANPENLKLAEENAQFNGSTNSGLPNNAKNNPNYKYTEEEYAEYIQRLMESDPVLAFFLSNKPYYLTVTGNEVCSGPGITNRLITCVRNTIIVAVTSILGPISQTVAKAIGAMTTLAVIFLGIRIATGSGRGVGKDAILTVLKIGAVAMMTVNFGGYFPVLITSMQGTLEIFAQPAVPIVTANNECASHPLTEKLNNTQAYSNPNERNTMKIWNLVDCTVERLIGGILSPATLSGGIVGFLTAALFSTEVGIFIALMGFAIIYFLLFTIAKALYIFIMAYIAFSFMVIISPIFIPMILLKTTQGYFQMWLKMTLGFMLQPIFMFAFLVMFLVAMNVTIYTGPKSLYKSITKTAITNTTTFGQVMNSGGAYTEKKINETANLLDPKKFVGGVIDQLTGTQVKVAPGQKSNIEATTIDHTAGDAAVQIGAGKEGASVTQNYTPVRSLDWEALSSAFGSGNSTDYKIQVLLAFMMTLVVVFIFYELLEQIPFVGSGITSAGGVPMAMGAGKLAPPGGSVTGRMLGKAG
jgi:hypothetical protein